MVRPTVEMKIQKVELNCTGASVQFHGDGRIQHIKILNSNGKAVKTMSGEQWDKMVDAINSFRDCLKRQGGQNVQ